MMLLARHPKVLEKLREEAERIVKGEACTFDESKELKYHSQVIYETLRLYPTVPSFPRECHKDTILPSGYDIPAGSFIFVSQSGMNRDPKLWEKPDEFMPERFAGTGELQMGRPVGVPNGPKYGFVPFGAANRSCVGQRLAVLEANQILATLVLRCNWEFTYPDRKVDEVADITLGPKHGLYFNITPRIRNNRRITSDLA
jgi:cytochrome P450